MPVIHPNTLFHFTRTLTNLESILRDGLRFSYCFEEFVNGHGIALPMVCFCDIPLLRTPQHRKRYGNYMVGLSKDFFRQKTDFQLNPVMYRYSLLVQSMGVDYFKTQVEMIENSFLYAMKFYLDIRNYTELVNKNGFEKVLGNNEELRHKKDQILLAKANMLYFLAFSKLYATKKDGKRINNYDECEWRYIYPSIDTNNHDEEMWKLDIDKTKFEEDKTELNKQLWKKDDSLIILNKDICKSISFIVVRTDKQIEKMIKFIRNTKTIFGNSITQEEKDIIISKITSFESIENNY